MPRVAFVAHCLLNQNSKTIGGARCAGIYSPLVDDHNNHTQKRRLEAFLSQ